MSQPTDQEKIAFVAGVFVGSCARLADISPGDVDRLSTAIMLFEWGLDPKDLLEAVDTHWEIFKHTRAWRERPLGLERVENLLRQLR